MAKDLWRGSRALQEFQIACAIHDRGIPTAVPLLAAERVQRGLVYESLLALPFLSDACELKDFFLDPHNSCRNACSAAERRSIIKNFGRLTAGIFKAGIYQNDYSLNNFLIRKEAAGHRIYFIDCERAELKERITDREKTELLTKLNRAGREILVTDRLRFLGAYLEASAAAEKKLASRARNLQKETLAMLQRDLKRGRLTSIYTSGAYEKFSTAAFRGMHKSGYRLEEIAGRLAELSGETGRREVTMQRGSDTASLLAVSLERSAAGKLWAAINALKLAGLPLPLPHIYAQGRDCGFLFFNVTETGNAIEPDAVSPAIMKIIAAYFPAELQNVLSFLHHLSP
jgi:tRNA A-37 threonylcarbamoyl transferase component Bud32